MAGVAALLKDLNPAASPDEIYNALKPAAIDMDDAATPGFDMGFDFGTGFGLIRADVTFGPPPPPPPFEAEPARPRFFCRSAARCRLPVTCNRAQVAGNQCAKPIEIFVPRRALRTAGEALTKGPTLAYPIRRQRHERPARCNRERALDAPKAYQELRSQDTEEEHPRRAADQKRGRDSNRDETYKNQAEVAGLG